MSNPVCAKCGSCCYLRDKVTGVQTNKPCPFLVKLSDGTTKCKVYYRNRLGRNIGLGNKCHLRKNIHFSYPGCPLNVEGEPFVQRVDL